jgi:hypothetical protein
VEDTMVRTVVVIAPVIRRLMMNGTKSLSQANKQLDERAKKVATPQQDSWKQGDEINKESDKVKARLSVGTAEHCVRFLEARVRREEDEGTGSAYQTFIRKTKAGNKEEVQSFREMDSPATPGGLVATRSLHTVMTRPADVMNRFRVVAVHVTYQQHLPFIEVDLKRSPFNKEVHHETSSSSFCSRSLHRRYRLRVVNAWRSED